MPFNRIFSWLIKKRVHQIELFKQYPIEVQTDTLQDLVDAGSNTLYGNQHGLHKVKSYQDFQNSLPLVTYESLEPYISKTIQGDQRVLWPTEVKWFAKSSGTTSGKSKLIPVSKESLEQCHYKGGKDLLGLYYNNFPNTKLFNGKHLIVGGSAQINHLSHDSYFGDLSAIIIKNLPWWCEFRRTPKKETALLDQWEEKLERLAKETVKEDVHILAGVPSWTLVLLKRILEKEGTSNILDIWPNLELYMHGGVSFQPYKDQFKSIIPSNEMNYIETYNASEGFFGIQDQLNSNELLLMLDYGIFYEFIPMTEFNDSNRKAIPLSEVAIGVNYAIVISTNGGLWRYIIGDTVSFTSLEPYRFKITGRTKQHINAFGEELIVDNAEKAIGIASERSNCSVSNFTGCPVYMDSENTGAHEWLVEFNNPPSNIDFFRDAFDHALMSLNSDYEAKRSNDLTLKKPQITILPYGTFYAWLKSKGKVGGQNKIPRLCNDRIIVNEIKALL